MAVRIRLSRGGTKKRPFYRIVSADSRSPRDGRFLEKLGTYNPLLDRDDPNRVVLKEERIKHWLAHGATPSERVARFLGAAGIIPMPAIREQPIKSLPKTKARERMKEAQAAASAAAEEVAKKAAEPAAEEPAEETVEAAAEPTAEEADEETDEPAAEPRAEEAA